MPNVQSRSVDGVGTSLVLAFASNNTLGNLLVYGYVHSSGDDVVTDTNNTPTSTVAEAGSAFYETAVYRVENCAAGANTVTVSGAGTVSRSLCIGEWSGVVTTSALDQQATANGSSTAADSGATSTTTEASELLVGFVGSDNANAAPYTPGGSWVELQDLAGGNLDAWLAEQTVSVTGTYSVTATQTGTSGWRATILTFKLIPPPPPPPVRVGGTAYDTSRVVRRHGFPVIGS